jgi:hypothetical protein
VASVLSMLEMQVSLPVGETENRPSEEDCLPEYNTSIFRVE